MKAHSRLVHVLRWLLPTIIFAIIGVLGGFVALNAMRSMAARPKEVPTEIQMVNPRFLGRDSQGRVFDLSARRATRDDHDMRLVRLTAPVMVMNTADRGPTTLIADSGVYREDTRILHLTGHVRLADAKASAAATEEAVVDTRAGTVTGLSPVAGASPTGSIQARGYSVTDRGDRLILHGGVHARLNGGASAAPAWGKAP
jgi:lipopolysaccharide export system protein LptC